MNASMYSEIIYGLSAIIKNQKEMAKDYEKQHKQILEELKEIKAILRESEDDHAIR